MAWALSVSPILENRLRDGQLGLLVCAVDTPNQTITGVGSLPAAAEGFKDAADAVRALLPQGLHVAGSYTPSSDSDSKSWKPNASNVPVVTATNTADGALAWTVGGQSVTAATPPALSAAAAVADCGLHIVPGSVPLRCHLDVQLNVQYTPAASSSMVANGASNSSTALSPPAAAVQAAIQQLQQSLLTDQLAFISERDLAEEGQQHAAPVLITSSSTGTAQEILRNSSSSSSAPCLSLLPLQSSNSSDSKPSAPMFEYEPTQQQQQQVVNVILGLDVLCYAPNSMPLQDVPQQLLVPALHQQLACMQQLLQQQAADGQQLVPVRAYHFLPPGLGFPITVCYPMLHQSLETTELKLLSRRQQLHQLLGLPSNMPMLRFANALDWSNGAAADGIPKSLRLRNVHEGLAPPGFGGKLYLIDGAYEYYHYMQDKFNDNGWGCAYRSLQTIVSWFRLQKYTNKPVPGHRQIQEILVALGDKEASFIGSSNWIGAIELSYILDEYIGITSKVLTVNRGSEIPANARALAQHFTTQGTPVMIGGGVLAYTLLGVAFDEDTGEAAFLILDPHYTGGEDLKKIWQGTWVGWKQLGDNAAAGGPLFVKDAFYNFLCPQRPCTV